MNKEINEGEVVMVPTGQAGTFIGYGSDNMGTVLLRNGDIWIGNANQLWYPTSKEELDQAPIESDRFKNR